MPLKESTAHYLVFVEHQDDCSRLEHYVAKRRISKSDILVIALGVETHKDLEEHSWRFRPLEEVFDYSSYEHQLWTEGIALADTWFKTLPLEDYYFEQVTIPDFRRFFTHALACQLVLDNTLHCYPTCHVILLPSNQTPLSLYFGYQRQISRNEVFKGVLRWHCRQHSLPTLELESWPAFNRVKCSLSLWITVFLKIVKHLRGPTRRVGMYLLNTLRHIVCSQRGKNAAGSGSVRRRSESVRADVMIANWDLDMRRNMRLTDVIHCRAFSQIEMVHLSNNMPSLEAVPANHRIISTGTYVPWGRYLSEFVVGVFLRRLKAFRQSRQELATKHSKLFRNTALDFQFLHLFFDVYGIVYHARYRAQKLLERYAPRVYIASDIDTAEMRAQLLAAKDCGTITMTTNHGFYLYAPPSSNFQADYCLVGGPSLKRNLMNGGVSAERIRVIGNPSFQIADAYFSAVKLQRTKIVIITAAPYLWSFQFKPAVFLQFVETLCCRLSTNDNWDVIIKSHPITDHYGYYDGIVQRYGLPNLQHVSKSWKREEFEGTTVAICLGKLSGSMLELQSFGTPIVYLDAVTAKAPQWDYQGCGVVAKTTDEVCEAVGRLVRDAKYRQAIVDQGFAFLQKYTNFPHNSLNEFSSLLWQTIQKPAVTPIRPRASEQSAMKPTVGAAGELS
jgi:hypothetical protein